MPMVMMASTSALAKAATEASRVEKPPVATAVIAWTPASSQFIPAR